MAIFLAGKMEELFRAQDSKRANPYDAAFTFL